MAHPVDRAKKKAIRKTPKLDVEWREHRLRKHKDNLNYLWSGSKKYKSDLDEDEMYRKWAKKKFGDRLGNKLADNAKKLKKTMPGKRKPENWVDALGQQMGSKR